MLTNDEVKFFGAKEDQAIFKKLFIGTTDLSLSEAEKRLYKDDHQLQLTDLSNYFPVRIAVGKKSSTI